MVRWSVPHSGGICVEHGRRDRLSAWAQLDTVTAWLQKVPQPSALVLFLVAVAGVLVGRMRAAGAASHELRVTFE
ncbi:hypothetical protein HRJ34_20440 [Rhizorhabdus wittichii]|uniref:Uncharacterized protein n=1 Tax=Rhizorhabdus wittichii TaxID=160791 RepID=A0A975D1U1_9SPHN|nr:hypothetical protein [Rhizorhabdus wittichii]QTH20681.1 hypothetical protein HRJ34_20440 [Rhizorhabdus wittichii]